MTAISRVHLPGFNRQVALYLVHSALLYVGVIGLTDVVLNFYYVSLGYSPDTIGLLQGMPRLGGLLTGLPVGMVANRVGARHVTIAATIGASLTFPLMVIWPALPILFASRFLLGLAFGATQIASAPLMMTLTAREYQTHQFSYHSVVTMIANAFASIAAGYLPTVIVAVWMPPHASLSGIANAQTPFAYGVALLFSGVITALSSVPVLCLQETLVTNEAGQSSNYRLKDIPWLRFAYLTLPFLIFGFTGGLTFPFYNLFFRTTFSVSDNAVGVILGLGWLSMGLITLTNPWWDRRFGRASALGIAMTIAAVAFVLLSIAPTLGLSIAAYMVAIGMRNMMSPLYQPMLMESIEPASRNLISSVGYVMWNIGWFAATVVGGLWQVEHGFTFIMQVVAVGVLMSGATVFLIFRNRQAFAN